MVYYRFIQGLTWNRPRFEWCVDLRAESTRLRLRLFDTHRSLRPYSGRQRGAVSGDATAAEPTHAVGPVEGRMGILEGYR
jgi:hypothetical protein